MKKEPNQSIVIFDTTLRDGEQAPGYSMTLDEKLRMAKQLERLGVDIIEAGFAAASPGDFESVLKIASELKNCTVCSLSRALPNDIDAAAQALSRAANPRIHTFLATSDLHLKYKLRMTHDRALEQIRDMVAYARNKCADVEFSAEDATRTNPDFLCRAIETAIASGATTVNLPDTVGYATNEILRAISDEVKYLYLPGIRYRKTGIVFFGLEKPGTAHQLDLFADASTPAPRQSALYKAVDALNAKYGKGKVFSASEGIGKKSWHMKRQKLTPRPTTRWDELIVVR